MDSSVEDLELPVETPGGYLVPNCGEQVDFDRVSTWVAKCVSAHGDFCNIPTHVLSGNAISNHISESYPGLKTFRLIDVDQECIIETTTTCRYVTLSYLWGNAANLRLTTVNFSSLLQPKALQKYTSLVPRTIQDAITFVRAIGERYLWCDALCLVQNDPEDVGNGVKAMDLIYENALLTIVAACGHDANAGLLGVSPGTRLATTETAEVAPGVKLGYYIGLDEYLKRLPYSSRAWTFQEELLSRRMVYFVDEKVYFRCRSVIVPEQFSPRLDEDFFSPMPNTAQGGTTVLPLALEMRNPTEDFGRLLFHYSKRSLTYQTDVLNAMAGIIRRLSSNGKCRFLEGMPAAAVDLFILFRSHGSPLHRRQGFPSYSWTGWRGLLVIPDQCRFGYWDEWLNGHTWIRWYWRGPAGILDLVWDPAANEQSPFNNLKYFGYRRRYFDCPHVELTTAPTQPTEDRKKGVRAYNLLQFWTLSVFFNLRIVDSVRGEALVWDLPHDRPCGRLFLDGLEDGQFHESDTSIEIIVLSSVLDRPAFMFSSRTEPRDWLEDSGLDPTTPAYNVMVIEWMGGVAERRGIGVISQGSVADSYPPGPVWKEIVLG